MLLRINETTYENVLPLILNDANTCTVMSNSGTFVAHIDDVDNELLHIVKAVPDIFTAMPRDTMGFTSFQANNADEYAEVQKLLTASRKQDEEDVEKKAFMRKGWKVSNFGNSDNYETTEVTIFGEVTKVTLLNGDIYRVEPARGQDLYFQNITKHDYDSKPNALILPLVLPYSKFNSLGIRTLEAIVDHVKKVSCLGGSFI